MNKILFAKVSQTCFEVSRSRLRDVSRIDFGELFKVKTYLKEVWKPKEDLRKDLNRSNPTVEVKECLLNVFKQDLGQNRRRIMFLKESENITKSFTLSSIPFRILEQHRDNIG